MLADDDAGLLKEASDALREAGFKVVEAADGQEALQEALSRRVDLIVMDISMPEVSGVEACHCLKAMPKTQKIPVVLTVSKKDPVARTLGEWTHGCDCPATGRCGGRGLRACGRDAGDRCGRRLVGQRDEGTPRARSVRRGAGGRDARVGRRDPLLARRIDL